MIVYGIYNNITNQIYIGSSIEPSTRVYNHLISSKDSNVHLQSSIKAYGLPSFTFVVFSVLELSNNLTKLEKKDMIIPLEQKYLDMFPKSQLYNFLYVADSKLGSNHSEESRLLMFPPQYRIVLGGNRERSINSIGSPVPSRYRSIP
jgi:group I intron endonuclease